MIRKRDFVKFRNAIQIDIYGASHADAVGVVIEGLPAGEEIDRAALAAFLARRVPGAAGAAATDAIAGLATTVVSNAGEVEQAIAGFSATTRREPDDVVFRSGVRVAAGSGDDRLTGSEQTVVTTGEPLDAYIRNVDARPGDYDALRTVLRPGHADLGAFLKYGLEGLQPGGGRHSGRMTAPLCIAGGIAKQILARRGITVQAAAVEIGGIACGSNGGPDAAEWIIDRIEAARAAGDSLGGIVECRVCGMPAGVGDALFDGLERDIASAVFAIPAVKGLELGAGFAAARMTGLENNDDIVLRDGVPVTVTNHCGGLSGGITTGADIVFRVAFKPVPTIATEQRTVDVGTMQETTVRGTGRHDVCIVPRAVPVVEAAAAVAVLDRLLYENRTHGTK